MNNKFIIKTSMMTLVFGLMVGTYSFANTSGTVTGDRVNVRTGPSTSTTVITQYNTGNKVTILAKEGEWYKISLADGQIAYMFGEYIKEDVAADEAPAEEVKAETSDIRTEIVNYAKQFLGNPYRYGGTSLTNGTDCSGFTQQIFKHFGYSLNRSSSSQYSNGTSVSVSDLLPGDLVFFGYSGKISHVAIYIGENKIIHASTSSTGIIISGLYDRGNKPFIGSRRII